MQTETDGDAITPEPVEVQPSVYSEGVKAHISHEVIATYAADAVRDVPGVTGLASASLPQRLTTREGVRVIAREEAGGGAIDLDLHVLLAPGASCRDLGRQIGRAVRSYLGTMTDLRVGRVRCFVEGIAT